MFIPNSLGFNSENLETGTDLRVERAYLTHCEVSDTPFLVEGGGYLFPVAEDLIWGMFG